jgi:hypothetical protein
VVILIPVVFVVIPIVIILVLLFNNDLKPY